jgi:hypothetical protein
LATEGGRNIYNKNWIKAYKHPKVRRKEKWENKCTKEDAVSETLSPSEYRTMGKVQTLRNPECYTSSSSSSSEPFGIDTTHVV